MENTPLSFIPIIPGQKDDYISPEELGYVNTALDRDQPIRVANSCKVQVESLVKTCCWIGLVFVPWCSSIRTTGRKGWKDKHFDSGLPNAGLHC